MLRQFAVALAVSLPLAAQVSDALPLLRVDVVAIDDQGNRVRGLTPADFEIVEKGERRGIVDFTEFSSTAKQVAPATDTAFVALKTPASPTPKRRLTVVFGDEVRAADREAAMTFLQKHTRQGDVVSVASDGDFDSRMASSILQLARYPEKKGIVLYGEASPAAIAFAQRRGVSIVEADAIEDLANYYSISFRGRNAGAIEIKTTRPYTLLTTFAAASLPAANAMSDRVLLHQVIPPRTNLLQIALEAGKPVVAEGKRSVKLNVLIPIRHLTLARDGANVTGGIDVYVSVGDRNGTLGPVTKQTHSINWPAEAYEQAGERKMTYAVDVELDAGPARISVGVFDQRSRKTGYARIEVSE